MKAGIRAITAAAALVALSVAVAAPAEAADGSEAKAGCDLTTSEGESLGTSYVTPLSVKGTSCDKGKEVVIAFNKCRKANGGADGHCNSKVKGYKCSEGKRTSSPAQYSASVVCKNDSKKVAFTYTQNT